MIRIKYTHNFKHDLALLLENDPLVEDRVNAIVGWFVRNPKDTRLELHALKKRLKGKYAISVTDEIRIIFEWLGKQHARFLAIGYHYQVYSGSKKL